MDGDDVLPSASSDVVALKSDDAAAPGAGAAAEEVEESRVELIAKWRGEEIVLDPVPVSSTVLLVKVRPGTWGSVGLVAPVGLNYAYFLLRDLSIPRSIGGQ
jgi:hypothetical protein